MQLPPLIKNILVLTLTLSPIFSQAKIDLNIDPTISKVKFEATGRPSLMKIKADGAHIAGKMSIEDNKLSGIFKVKLNEFDTGISLRNEHMKEKYLEVTKYPEATLEIMTLNLPNNWNNLNSTEIPFSGKLSLKDTSKVVTGIANLNGKKLQANVNFEFKLSDYNVGIPSYMGIIVADLVKVSAEVIAQTHSNP